MIAAGFARSDPLSKNQIISSFGATNRQLFPMQRLIDSLLWYA